MIRAVLDTNVLMSGIFWSGPPSVILQSWQMSKFKLIISPDILNEYFRVGEILSQKYPGIDVSPIIDLIAIKSELYSPIMLEQPISRDPDDEKFIATCLAANCKIIISGDKDQLDISGYKDIQVFKPSYFVTTFLHT